jgi:nitronate monooxygenase
MIPGAEGVQLGTAFLACAESNATVLHKEKLFFWRCKIWSTYKGVFRMPNEGNEKQTYRRIEGIWKRLCSLSNAKAFFKDFISKGHCWYRQEFMAFLAGQSAPLLKYKGTMQLFTALVEDTEKILKDSAAAQWGVVNAIEKAIKIMG